MKKIFLISLFLLGAIPVFAENYLLSGTQEARISYQMIQKATLSPSVQKLTLSYVIPKSFDSPTYRQHIMELKVEFSPPPIDQQDSVDERGNTIVEVTWGNQAKSATTTISFTAINSVSFKTLQSSAPFPPGQPPEEIRSYLNATAQVPSSDIQIQAKAMEITAGSLTQFDAVQRILTWMADHITYVTDPKSYDAKYSLYSGNGNCQSYAHLAAALMRAVLIPVRIVSGITLKRPYDIQSGKNTLTIKMAQGRYSWIEVWFPDLGWMPFDPRNSLLFVSNRFIRVETGLDNSEARNDGLIRWTRENSDQPAADSPRLEESIYAEFSQDDVNVTGEKTEYGPRKILLCPRIEAAFAKIPAKSEISLPERIPKEKLAALTYSKPYIFGNLEFPEGADFLSSRDPAIKKADGTMEMRKNFLAETAEYVTASGQQYAQTFILEKPLKLKTVGLVLHKFNDTGQLWTKLLKDDKGIPGEPIATSDILSLSQMKPHSGYSWTDFDFRKASPVLSPGRYWIVLGFTDSPIVNWFFTYGKPVGPADGTCYKKIPDTTWSRSLSYEFNYRVAGLTTIEN